MIRAVLDTNVLAPGFAFRGGVPDRVLRAWQDERFELVVSSHILAELRRTFASPYFRARFSTAQVQGALALLRRRATVVAVTARVVSVATHSEDDLILAAAVSAGADYLVTGDKQLVKLEAFRGVTIATPRAFLDVLDCDNEPG